MSRKTTSGSCESSSAATLRTKRNSNKRQIKTLPKFASGRPEFPTMVESAKAREEKMKRAIRFNGFTPVPGAYETGALLPDKPSADNICKGINDLNLGGSSGWTVEELKLEGNSYWRVVWLEKKA
jgi:hypothetical protein